MRKNIHVFDVDIKNPTYMNEPIVRQNDSVVFKVNITDDGEPYDLSQVSVLTLATKGVDGNILISAGIVTAFNQVTFEIPRSTVTHVGKAHGTVQLYGLDKRVSTLSFTFQVEKDPTGEDWMPTTGERTLIEVVLGRGPMILAEAEQATIYATDQGNYAREELSKLTTLNQTVTEQEEERTSNEVEREENESSRSANELERVASEIDRVSAETARINQEEKRQRDAYQAIAEALDAAEQARNAEGPQGEKGEQGLPGPQGEKGEKGEPGRDGDGAGTVTAVNGVEPDESGNVELPEIDLTSYATKKELKSESTARESHEERTVENNETHGMRIVDGVLQYLWEGEWKEVESGSDGIEVATVENLIALTNDTGDAINLTWSNPINGEFIRTEIYASAVDLSSAKVDYIIERASLISDSADAESFEYPTTHGKLTYFYAFAIHETFGTERYSDKVSVSALAVDTTPPAPITSFRAVFGNEEIILNWINPTDADFAKVTIIKNQADYPESKTDGTVVYEGRGTSVELTNLTNDEKLFFRAFTEDTAGNINDDISQIVSETPRDILIYGVKIDTTNSNPESAVTYTDRAIGFKPLRGNNGEADWGSWADIYPFDEITPVVVKSGEEQYELDPNDFTKKKDGTDADIISGDDGDVFIRFPKIWWNFERVGTDLYVRIATDKVDETYKCLAHTKAGLEYDHVYIGAYIGFHESGKLRSLSGKTPVNLGTSGRLANYRNYARAHGEGYEQFSYYELLMLQVLTLIATKNRDSQVAVGRGHVGDTTYAQTGGADEKGMIYGETTGEHQLKLFGIEDFWGNYYQFIDGVRVLNATTIQIGDSNFIDNGSTYDQYTIDSTANINGFFTDVQGGIETGFIPSVVGGSETTHYSDVGSFTTGAMACFGGNPRNLGDAGVFSLQLNITTQSGIANQARLCFHAKKSE